MKPEEAKTRQEIYDGFKSIIEKHGTKTRAGIKLFTFSFCSDCGVSLAGSTIDSIVLTADGIRFYYNENTGDYDSFDDFTTNELSAFLSGIRQAVADIKWEYTEKAIARLTFTAIGHKVAALEFTEDITGSVVEYLENWMKKTDWGADDVRDALLAVLIRQTALKD